MFTQIIKDNQEKLKNLKIKKRDYVFFDEILSLNKIVSFIWPRRVGKTYLMFQFLLSIIESWFYRLEQVIFIDFSIFKWEIINPEDIINSYFSLWNKDKPILIFDEIQDIENFQKVVLQLYNQWYQIFISWSNSKLLSSELVTEFRWRVYEYFVYPLNFKEVLEFNNIKIEKIYSSKIKWEIKSIFTNILKYWTFPELILSKHDIVKTEILKTYFDILFYKDLTERYKIDNEKAIRFLIKRIILWNTKRLNLIKIFNELKDSPIDSMKIKSLYWGAESKRYLGDEKKAVLLYTEFLNKFSDSKFSSNVKFSLASIYYKQNKKEKAKRILLSSLNVSEANPKCEIYTLLGEIVLEKKNYKSADNYFKIASEISKADGRLIQHAQLGLAVSKYYLNNFNEAITILNSIKKRKNIDVDINKLNYFLGESYFAVGKFSNAIDVFNLVSGKNSDLIRQSLYGKAYSYFNNRDYINATFYFRNYVNNYKRIGNYYNAKLRLADSYYGTKEFNKSVKLFNELFALRNKLKLSDYSYYQYGQALYKAGNMTKAVNELTVLQQKFPKSKYADDAQFIIAWMYFKQSDYDRAIDEYNLVLQNYSKTPLKPIVFYSIGDSYFNKGSYENAISYYAKVIDDFPNSSYVYDAVSGIQYCYIAKDQPDNAVNFIDQFVENHPNSKYSAKILLKKGEIYFSNENYKSAENSYFELIQKYPQSKHVPNAHYWIGKSAAILSEDSTAEENFLKVIALSPKSEIGVSATLELGKIYNSKNQFDKAIKLYSDEAAKIPKSKRVPEILFVKAQAQLNAQKISEAFSTFNQIIYYYDKTIFGAKARIEMGLIELARQSFENAEILFKDLSEKRTDDLGAKAQYYYGLTLFEQNKIDDAISAFVRVESLFADYQEWYLKSLIKLGDCYVKLGDKKKAKSIYKSIYRKHKNDEYGREAKSKYRKLW